MKNVKAPAVEPKLPARKPKAKFEIIVLKEKLMRPMKISTIISESKKGGWKLTYLLGKATVKFDHTFSSPEACLSFLNAQGRFKIFKKNGTECKIA